MIRVYLASPYTNGDVAINVNRVIDMANQLADKGYAPYIPHLTHFWHIITPRPYDFWLKLDNEFLKCCDCILRLEGNSKGADNEVALALKLEKPVFYSISELLEWNGILF